MKSRVKGQYEGKEQVGGPKSSSWISVRSQPHIKRKTDGAVKGWYRASWCSRKDDRKGGSTGDVLGVDLEGGGDSRFAYEGHNVAA